MLSSLGWCELVSVSQQVQAAWYSLRWYPFQYRLYTISVVNVNVISLPTEHQRAAWARFKGDCAFQVELEFKKVGF